MTRAPLATPSQVMTDGAAAEPAVTSRPRATTPRVWVMVTEAASGRTSFIRARPPRAVATAAMSVLPCPGATACSAPRPIAMNRASAAKPTVRSLRATRESRARVQRSAPRGSTEAAGASRSSSTSAGPPGRTVSAADKVSAGEESNSSGYSLSSPDSDSFGTSDSVSVIRSPRAVTSRHPGPDSAPAARKPTARLAPSGSGALSAHSTRRVSSPACPGRTRA